MSGKDAQDNKPKGPSPVPLPSASHAPVSIAGISLSSTLPTSISSTHMSPHTTTHPTDASSTMTTTRRKSSTISQVAVDALGDLLESASVLSAPDTQEQRRKLNYKSTALIAKTLKQSQEERRRQALAEQAKVLWHVPRAKSDRNKATDKRQRSFSQDFFFAVFVLLTDHAWGATIFFLETIPIHEPRKEISALFQWAAYRRRIRDRRGRRRRRRRRGRERRGRG